MMVLAPAAEATPAGLDDAESQAFPGKRAIEVRDNGATFGAPLQEPYPEAPDRRPGIRCLGAAVHRNMGDVGPMPGVDRRHAPRPRQASGCRRSRFLALGIRQPTRSSVRMYLGSSASSPSLRLC